MNDAIIEQKSREMYEKIRASRPQLNITGTAYYVSADGNDVSDGLSPETAWKTPEGVNTHFDGLQDGDAVLFRCGDVFRGRVNLKKALHIQASAKAKNRIYMPLPVTP